MKRLLILTSILCLYALPIQGQDVLIDQLNEIRKSDLSQQEIILAFQTEADRFQNLNDSTSLGLIYHEFAKVYGSSRGYLDAIDQTERALEIRQKLSNSDDERKSLFNLGFYNKKALNHSNALSAFKSLVEQDQFDVRHAKAMNEIGLIYWDIGDYELALQYFISLEKRLVDANMKDGREYMNALFNKMALFYITNKFDRIDEAKTNYSDIVGADEMDVWYKAKASLSYGNLVASSGDYLGAIPTLSESLNYFKAAEDAYGVAVCQNSLSYCFIQLGQLERAKILLDQSAESVMDIKEEQWVHYAHLGEIFDKQEVLDKSIFYYDKAIQTLFDGQSPDLNGVSFQPLAVDYLLFTSDKATAFMNSHARTNNANELQQAIEQFQLSDQLVEQIKSNHKEASSKLFWREKVKPLYDKGVHALALGDRNDEAFAWIEKSKAVVLLDAMIDNMGRDQSSIAQSLLDDELSLRQRIAGFQVDIMSNATDIDSLQAELAKLTVELDAVKGTISEQNPGYVRSRYESLFLSVDEVRSHLNENETMVNFLQTDSILFRSALTLNSHELVALPWSSRQEDRLQRFISSMKTPFSSKVELSSYRVEARYWNNYLLSELDLPENIVILPDGVLNFLPFEALVNADDEPLLLSHNINYGYSASTVYAGRLKNKTRGNLVFAPVDYSYDNLATLTNSESEAERLPKSKTTFLFRDEATKANLFNSWSDREVLHISSHAQVGEGEVPWIGGRDEKIYLPELYNQRLDANLVVLSACETSVGDEVKGEGVMSLARGFFHSGAESVMASLWRVNEESTAEIMDSFYRYIRQGKPKATALRMAKLDYYNENTMEGQSPYYWSGLAYYGLDETISIKSSKKPIFIAVAGLTLFLILIRMRNRKN